MPCLPFEGSQDVPVLALLDSGMDHPVVARRDVGHRELAELGASRARPNRCQHLLSHERRSLVGALSDHEGLARKDDQKGLLV